MPLSSLPPASSPIPETYKTTLEDHLDAQILRLHQQIANLRKQKSQLARALLGSTRGQKYVHDRKAVRNGNGNSGDKLQDRLDEAVEGQRRENDVAIYRLAMGVTSFPFTDPAPERHNDPAMLGVRFDLAPPNSRGRRGSGSGNEDVDVALGQDAEQVGSRNEDVHAQENTHVGATADNTYFVMLRRLNYQARTYLKLHHHTVPGHIDVQHYADHYLPLPDALQDDHDGSIELDDANGSRAESAAFEDDSGIDVTQDIQVHNDGSPSSNNQDPNRSTTVSNTVDGNGQDLQMFVRSLKDDLQSWHNRSKSIAHLRQELRLKYSSTDTGASPRASVVPDLDEQTDSKYSVISLEQTTHDARQIKIVWQDESLGILRIAHDGTIDRAVVFGPKPLSICGHLQSESDSQLSEPESDDDTNIIRAHARAHSHTQREEAHANQSRRAHHQSHTRMHEVERLLSVDEGGEKVMVTSLVDRLRVVDGKVFSASGSSIALMSGARQE